MANFSQMKSYVSQRLLDPSNTAVSSTVVGDAINDAIRYWKFHKFWFNTNAAVITLTTSNPLMDLSAVTDFLVEDTEEGFVLEYSSVRYVLSKVPPKTYDDFYLLNGAGQPYIYTVKVGQYYCYFIPDQNYTIRVYYLKEYQPLINDGDTNDFSQYAERLIELWALANLYAELRQDDKMESYYRSAADNEFENLGVMNAKVNATGNLTIHGSL